MEAEMFEVKDRRSGEVILRLHNNYFQERYLGPLIGKDLSHADFSGLDLRDAVLTGRDLSGAKFDDADLTGAKYDLFTLWPGGFDPKARGAVRVPADLHGLNRSGADLSGLDLREGNLLGANLSGADLTGADLRGAVLNGANLEGANLTDAHLEGADLHAVRADGATIWPEGFDRHQWLLGFDPEARKAAKQEEERLRSERETEERVAFLKALADKSRLRLIALLTEDERTVEELAAALGVKEPTVSHHLNRLKEQDLIRMRAEGTVHYYSVKESRLAEKLGELTPQSLQSAAADLDYRKYSRKVLQTFFEDGQLTAMPMQPKKRRVILEYLLEEFKPGVRYTEKQVSETLKRFHPDYALLRREMIEEKMMEREKGIYWRTLADANSPALPVERVSERKDDTVDRIKRHQNVTPALQPSEL
jgi:predicted transcriptional regulator